MGLTLKMRSSAVKLVSQAHLPEGVQHEEHVLSCVVGSDKSPENEKWSKWTPSGKLEFTCNNPDAFGQIEPGRDYLVTITPAE